MSCHKVQKSISAFVDRKLPVEERERITRHLRLCRECSTYSQAVLDLRTSLRRLPARPVPEQLSSELQVLASRERARRLSRLTWSALFAYWRGRMKLVVDNMMRPLAVPFAGGLISALVLFSMLVPTLGFRHNFRNDVPIGLYTQASLDQLAPFVFGKDDVMVELTIDKNGSIVDYCVPHGEVSKDVVNSIGNMMLFTSFTPATWFGQPTSGKIWVSFRRSHIVVKG
jgi:hypothetical protein